MSKILKQLEDGRVVVVDGDTGVILDVIVTMGDEIKKEQKAD